MNIRSKQNSKYSIGNKAKKLLLILLPVVVINIAVSLLAITITRQQSIDYIKETINLYLADAELKINAVQHFIRWSILNEPIIDNIAESKSIGERSQWIRNFRTRVSDFQYSSGEEFQFFISLPHENLFFNASALQIDYPEYLKVKEYFLTEGTEKQNYKTLDTWQTLQIGDNYYLYYMVTYNNRTFICLISIKDILLPLQNINLGTNGYMIMKDEGYKFFSNKTIFESLEDFPLSELLQSHLVFNSSDNNLPFSLHVYIDHFSAFEKIVLIEFAVLIMAISITLILLSILFYMSKKVIKPIQDFSKNLASLNENSDFLNLQSSNIIELEDANEQFKNLMREIKKLKINIYEQELEKKKIQIDFMQQQIKPHFYLNCLTIIHSMAQTHMYKEIEEMALSTAKYFRYLFQTNQDFVKLENELTHINDYLSIQQLRYGSVFSYECKVEFNAEQAKIPPLVIQTFIENAIKHAVSLDEKMKITLVIEYRKLGEDTYLNILIRDTGIGFSDDILNKLENNEPLTSNKGTHIGVTNVIQRLRLLYETNFSIHFFNNPDGGAAIELFIPYFIYEEC